MNKLLRVMSFCIVALTCMNTSQQESQTAEKPQVNFSGVLSDTSDQTSSVENITISGLYKNIPFYSVPATENDNPESNTTFIDLTSIKEIQTAPVEGIASRILKYNKRSYSKIIVQLHDASQQIYIVETTRRIFCDIMLNGSSIEKRVSFEALKTLTISGFKAQEVSAAEGETRHVTEKERNCEEVGKTLHQLHEEIQKVPDEHKNILTELVESAKNWVGSICSVSPAKK